MPWGACRDAAASSAGRCAARARRSRREGTGPRRPSVLLSHVVDSGNPTKAHVAARLRRPRRVAHLFLPPERRPPADAEALSHKLMVRAGLVRQLGAGLWTWLPAGWAVHERIVDIIREELNAIGAQEMLAPLLNPADLWKRSGRYDIDEVFK